MAAGRPFPDRAALLDAADRHWRALGAEAWLEAFRGHPRIGERDAAPRDAAPPAGDRGARWSEQEQAGARRADPAVLAALADANRDYEARFGHIFLICATGRSAGEMLAALRARLENPPDVELRTAAEEQRKITRLRLEKMLSP
jgi:2-oxo-4-hydroxy-4-carboxy-5-ureidoimidazoline decarboxylase